MNEPKIKVRKIKTLRKSDNEFVLKTSILQQRNGTYRDDIAIQKIHSARCTNAQQQKVVLLNNFYLANNRIFNG